MPNIKLRAIIDCSYPMVHWYKKIKGKNGDAVRTELCIGQALYAIKLLDSLVNTVDYETKISLDKVVFTGDIIPNAKISTLTVTNPADLTALGNNINYAPPTWKFSSISYRLRDLVGSDQSPPRESIMKEVEVLYDDVATAASDDYYVFIVFANSPLSCDNDSLKKIISHIETGCIPLLSVYYVRTENIKKGETTDLLDANIIHSGLARIQDASRRVSRDAKVPYQTYRQCTRILSLRNATMDNLDADTFYLRKLIKDAYTNSSRHDKHRLEE